MSDFQIGTQYGVAKNDTTGRDPNATTYAGTHGFVTQEKYQELVDTNRLGRGEQARSQVLATLGGGIQNAYETVVPNGVRKSINTNALNAWNVTQQVAQGAWDAQPKDHQDFVLASLHASQIPLNAVHSATKYVDPTNRGVSKAVLGDLEMVLPFAGAAKNVVKGGLKKTLGKIDDVATKALKTKQNLALAGDLIPPNGNGGNGFHKPFQMTIDEAGEVYGKVRNKEIGADLTGLQRAADPDVTRIARKVDSDQVDDLTRRQHNSYTASYKGSDPVEYLTKYYESRGLKAEAHHILDHDFWGQALNSPNGQIAGEALWTKGVKSGNDSANLVSSWSAKTKGYDHETLHRLYKTIDKRNLVNEMMAKGIWHKQPAEKQAKILREVADRQFRLTSNFYRIKLSAIKRNNPKLLKLTPQQLKEELFKNPQKYAEINPIEGFDYKNPQHVKAFQDQLNAIPNSGKVTEEMRVVFGLVIPKAPGIKYTGTANQKNFDLTIGPLTRRIARNNKKLTIKK